MGLPPHAVQLREQDFDEKVSLIWIKPGVARYLVVFEPALALKRSFGLHVLLTFVPLGI